MELKVTPSFEQSGIAVAEMFAKVIRQKPDALLGCATGSSVVGVYRHLAKLHREEGLDFSRVRTVNLDEYAGLNAEHSQSFAYFMEEHFFSQVNLKRENIYLVNGDSPDLQAEVERFNRFLAENPIDILMVGIGTNGHIGFNEPENVFSAKARLVQLEDATIQANARFFENESQVPRRAITMGTQGIVSAGTVVLIASGQSKADAIGQLLQNPNADPMLPCSIMRLCRDAHVVIDEELHRAAQPGKAG